MPPRNPEFELVLACARTRIDQEDRQRIRAILEEPLDEPRFWRLASDHCVEPLVYLCLSQLETHDLLEHGLAAAEARFHRVADRTLAFTRELHRVLGLLEAEGVPAVPYKGPLLAETAYGNLLARSFQDLDLAVRTSDRDRAIELLLADGYRSREIRSPELESRYLRESHEYELVSTDGRIDLEIHWRFSARQYPIGVTPTDLWDRLESGRLMGRDVLSFSPEDLLCLLAAHGSGHQWMRLDWVVCISEHVRSHPDLDWSSSIESARRWGVLRATYVALVLAADLLQAPIPAKVLDSARAEPSIHDLVEMIVQRLSRPPGASPTATEWWTYEMASRERARDRWPSLRHHLGKWRRPEGADRGHAPRDRGSRARGLARLLALACAPGLTRRLLRG